MCVLTDYFNTVATNIGDRKNVFTVFIIIQTTVTTLVSTEKNNSSIEGYVQTFKTSDVIFQHIQEHESNKTDWYFKSPTNSKFQVYLKNTPATGDKYDTIERKNTVASMTDKTNMKGIMTSNVNYTTNNNTNLVNSHLKDDPKYLLPSLQTTARNKNIYSCLNGNSCRKLATQVKSDAVRNVSVTQRTRFKAKYLPTYEEIISGKNTPNSVPIFVNVTTCSEINNTKLRVLTTEFTVELLSNEHLKLSIYDPDGMMILEFAIIGNVTESLYCTGLLNYEISASGPGIVGTHNFVLGFNSSLPVGTLTVKEGCWNTERNASCVTDVTILEEFWALPIIANLPLKDAFWDFSSNIFDVSYGWLLSLKMNTVGVNWNKLSSLNNTGIEELAIVNDPNPYEVNDVPTLPLLRILDFSGSTFSNVPWEQLQNVPRLEKLVIANSAFTEYSHQIINSKLSLLKVLDMSNLRASSFFFVTSEFSILTSLEELNLSHNKIQFNLLSFPFMANLRLLNLSFLITDAFKYGEDMFNALPALQILDLSGNNINNVSANLFKNQHLHTLYLAYNNIYEIDSASFLNMNYKLLDISYNHFRNFPSFTYCHIDNLNISNNKLSNIPNLSLNGTTVRYLDVSGNNISGWSYKDLFLYQNHSNISEIDNGGSESSNKTWVDSVDISFNSIQTVSEPMRTSIQGLRSINLEGNPFDCSDCSIPPFQNWLKIWDRNIVNSERLICSSPESKVGLRVQNITFYEEKCLAKVSHMFLVLGLSLGILMIITVSVTVVIYRHRFELSYIRHLLNLRRRKGEDQYESSAHDAFICFSGRDRSWVMSYLAPALENGSERYRLCLHDRDFPLGSRIVHNIVHAIEKSRRTIVVLTEEFVNSKWCQWELEMANHRMFENSKNFVILLELQRLQRENLPRHLRLLMDTRTYLEWPEDRHCKKDVGNALKRLKKALGPSIFQTTCERAPLINSGEEC